MTNQCRSTVKRKEVQYKTSILPQNEYFHSTIFYIHFDSVLLVSVQLVFLTLYMIHQHFIIVIYLRILTYRKEMLTHFII